MVNSFYIDANTKSHRALVSRLVDLKSTVRVINDGQYHQCPECARVYIETIKTEDELEDWLYKTKGIEYIGICITEKRTDNVITHDWD